MDNVLIEFSNPNWIYILPFWRLVIFFYHETLSKGIKLKWTVACAGLILAGAEKKLRGSRKTIRGGRLAPEGGEKNFCPPCYLFCPPGRIRLCPPGRNRFCPPGRFNSTTPAEFDSALGAELTRGGGGQKTLLYLEKEGEKFDIRSLSKLTVLFFLTLCISVLKNRF